MRNDNIDPIIIYMQCYITESYRKWVDGSQYGILYWILQFSVCSNTVSKYYRAIIHLKYYIEDIAECVDINISNN